MLRSLQIPLLNSFKLTPPFNYLYRAITYEHSLDDEYWLVRTVVTEYNRCKKYHEILDSEFNLVTYVIFNEE